MNKFSYFDDDDKFSVNRSLSPMRSKLAAYDTMGTSYVDSLLNDPNSEQSKLLSDQMKGFNVAGNVTGSTAEGLSGLAAQGAFGGTTPEKGWFGQAADWFGNKNNQMLVNAGLGVGQLGLGLASYLSQSDFLNKQGKLIDQQLASNRYEMDRRKKFGEGFAAARANAQKSAPTWDGPDDGQA